MKKVAQQVSEGFQNNFQKIGIIVRCGLVIVISMLSLFVNAQVSQTFYIDPTYKGTSSGSITQPYNTFPAMTSGNKYLIKGGTILILTNNNINYSVDNTTIGSYGTGLATIQSGIPGRVVYIYGSNNTIRDFNIVITNQSVTAGNTTDGGGLNINSGSRGYMINIHETGGWRGLIAGNYPNYSGTLVFKNCSVTTTQHDGIYICNLDSLIADSISSQNVNINWKNDIGGDCLQCESVRHVIVNHSYFDHTSMPGKYCLITNQYYNATVSNSTFKSNLNMACLYPGGVDVGSSHYTLTNSVLSGGTNVIQNRCEILTIVNCILSGSKSIGIESGDTVYIYNSVFANIDSAIVAWPNYVKKIQNTIFYNVKQPALAVGSIGSNNLFYNSSVTYNTVYNKFLGADIILKDPLLNSDFSLKVGSPCIDAGITTSFAYDLINGKRPVGKAYDVGAYEYAASPVIVVTPTPTPVVIPTPTPVVPTVDSLSIYRNMVKTVIIPGLQNKNTTKASILIGVQKIVK